MLFTRLACPWAIENPVGIMSTLYRKPDQIIQPWQFWHGETKATCLWLHNLPALVPTNIVSGREHRIWRMGPGPDRARERSKTYVGIAIAMADAWGRNAVRRELGRLARLQTLILDGNTLIDLGPLVALPSLETCPWPIRPWVACSRSSTC